MSTTTSSATISSGRWLKLQNGDKSRIKPGNPMKLKKKSEKESTLTMLRSASRSKSGKTNLLPPAPSISSVSFYSLVSTPISRLSGDLRQTRDSRRKRRSSSERTEEINTTTIGTLKTSTSCNQNASSTPPNKERSPGSLTSAPWS